VGTPTRRPQLDALTSLRFFAALHVVLYHGEDYLLPSLADHPALRNLIYSGPNSVGLFFVLSGFILTYTYLGPAAEGRLKRGSFWAARFARVYPVYFFGLLVAAPLAAAGFVRGGATLGRFAAVVGVELTLVQAWTPQFALAWNGPGWSLSAEAFFYLVFPFLVPLLWPLRRRGLLLALLAFWLLAQVGPGLYAHAPPGGWLGGWTPSAEFWSASVNGVPYHDWGSPWYTLLQYNPLGRLPEFLFGAAVGRLYLLRPTGGWPAAWSLAAVAAAVALLGALAYSPAPLRQSLYFHNGLLTPLHGALIYGLARGSQGAVARGLSLRPLVLLGEASYALYILHMPLKELLEAAVRNCIGDLPGVPFFTGYAAMAILGSVGVLRVIEEPARRLLRRRLGG
jgi:peptidoglycan/LPS O-acetylase OafA/YrhL